MAYKQKAGHQLTHKPDSTIDKCLFYSAECYRTFNLVNMPNYLKVDLKCMHTKYKCIS